MDVERIIDDIEQLKEVFEAPDIRPLRWNLNRLRIGFSPNWLMLSCVFGRHSPDSTPRCLILELPF